MVFGGVAAERLQLNEDTLWSGAPRDWDNPQARDVLPEVRRLLFAGQYAAADQLCRQMQGPFNQSYQPLGNLHLAFEHDGAPAAYRRELDLESALAGVSYSVGDATFTREAFASAPDQAIVLRLACDRPARISFSATLGSQLRHSLHTLGDDGLTLTGVCPSNVDPSYLGDGDRFSYAEGEAAMTFAIRLRVLAEGGRVGVHDGQLRVENADSVTLFLAAATSFEGYDHPALKDATAAAQRDLAAAAQQPYAQLRQRHIDDYQLLFQRVTLDLGQHRRGRAAHRPAHHALSRARRPAPGGAALPLWALSADRQLAPRHASQPSRASGTTRSGRRGARTGR